MRISLTLLFAVVLQLSAANGYAQRIRGVISMNNVSIEQVFLFKIYNFETSL